MKFQLTFLLTIACLISYGQKTHRVVMQFTDSDSISQASVVGQVRNIRADLPDAQVEVVCHGPGLDLLVARLSKVPAQTLAEWKSKGVVFAACNNTMRRRGVKKEDLVPEAQVVPSAMSELILKQEEGWSYVKGGH